MSRWAILGARHCTSKKAETKHAQATQEVRAPNGHSGHRRKKRDRIDDQANTAQDAAPIAGGARKCCAITNIEVTKLSPRELSPLLPSTPLGVATARSARNKRRQSRIDGPAQRSGQMVRLLGETLHEASVVVPQAIAVGMVEHDVAGLDPILDA